MHINFKNMVIKNHSCSRSCSNQKYPLLLLFQIRDGQNLLFLTPTPLLLREIQLQLQSDSKNFLISYSDDEIFKVCETNSDVKITFHPSIIFGFDFII